MQILLQVGAGPVVTRPRVFDELEYLAEPKLQHGCVLAEDLWQPPEYQYGLSVRAPTYFHRVALYE